MKYQIILSLLLLTFFTTSAQDQQLSKIDSLVNSKLPKNSPGLFVGVVQNGEIIYEGYRGLASLQHQVEVNELTRSNIASTAKQFTALMILDLALNNKLSLEDDIRVFLPKLYPEVQSKIRVRHLLNHTSGVRDFYDLMSIQQDPWWRKEGLSNEDAISLLEKQEDLSFEPGSRYMYSNSGYTLLAKIIEVVTKEDFHDYSENFFKKLGMNNTSFLKDYMHVIPNQALPYSDWGDGIWQQYPMITNLFGDGFLFTTLKDQLIYEQALQKAKQTNNELLIASQKPIPNSEITTYGFGLELEDRLNYPSVHHSGGTGSYHSQTIRFPEEKLSVFVMSNNSKLWSGQIADQIALLLLPKKEFTAKYNAKLAAITQDSKEIKATGQYLSPSNYLIRIQKVDGSLVWRNGNNNPIKLEQESNSTYSFSYNKDLKIGFREGKMYFFSPTGKVSEYNKMPETEITVADLESYVGQYHSRELEVDFTLALAGDKLMVSLGDSEDHHEVEVLNRNELLFFDYIMKIQRDEFKRVVAILLTTNRVQNNKFIKKTNLKFQPKIETENGTINVSTISSRDGKASQILLTKNYENGNEIWSKQFGGKSYDKASSILSVEDGYLIVGSTSSYGKGNYDVLLIKTDKKGKKEWQKTYGFFHDEYGYIAEETDSGYLIKGTTQKCQTNSSLEDDNCITKVWVVTTDKKGNEIANYDMEELK